MQFDRKTVFVIVVAVACGYWLATSPSSPVGPPVNDRPVLKFLARAAKTFLWVALVAEQPPKEDPEASYVVHSRVGEDGAPMINHARGW